MKIIIEPRTKRIRKKTRDLDIIEHSTDKSYLVRVNSFLKIWVLQRFCKFNEDGNLEVWFAKKDWEISAVDGTGGWKNYKTTYNNLIEDGKVELAD